MGCANSKLEDLPAVALCRDRCKYLEEALRHSQALAEAHAAYLDSLKALGPTIHRFFAQNVVNHRNNGEPVKPSSPAVVSPGKSNSGSNSESHLRLPSDSEDDDTDHPKEFDSLSRIQSNYLNEEETQGLISHNFNLFNSKPPPSPPQASLGSAWDFLNLFENFEKYERLYVSNSDREAKFEANVKKVEAEENSKASEKTKDGDTTTFEVRVVDKNGETKKESSELKANDSPASTTPNGTTLDSEAMNEIQVLFIQASESGNQVSKSLYSRLRLPLNQGTFSQIVNFFFYDFNLDLKVFSGSTW